ncbi:MAG: hypothetical protein OEM23_00640 [Gemmatimonadota bacterium]|nr:hypothetical protein [Gemmatimonadota bacterium]
MPTWILMIIVVMFVLSPLANAIGKAIESRASRPSVDHDEEGSQRIAGLEEQLQLLSDQVHELADKQDFLTRLLEASPELPVSAEPEDRIG